MDTKSYRANADSRIFTGGHGRYVYVSESYVPREIESWKLLRWFHGVSLYHPITAAGFVITLGMSTRRRIISGRIQMVAFSKRLTFLNFRTFDHYSIYRGVMCGWRCSSGLLLTSQESRGIVSWRQVQSQSFRKINYSSYGENGLLLY